MCETSVTVQAYLYHSMGYCNTQRFACWPGAAEHHAAHCCCLHVIPCVLATHAAAMTAAGMQPKPSSLESQHDRQFWDSTKQEEQGPQASEAAHMRIGNAY